MEEKQEENVEELEKEKKKEKKSGIMEWVLLIVFSLVLAFVIRTYVIERTYVDGVSMEDTLSDGGSVLVDKISSHFTESKRFSIITFYPYEGDRDTKYIKRIVGLPGETIQIKGNDIYINGDIVEEHYGKEPMESAGIAKKPITLKEEEYFVLGDNRNNSSDSRESEIGIVEKEQIIGKAVVQILPIRDIKLLNAK